MAVVFRWAAVLLFDLGEVMNLNAAISLHTVQAAQKEDGRFAPVHAGAHQRFVKIGYMHTGNKRRGGMTSSQYFKRSRSGNSRTISVNADGSFTKFSRTAKGERKSKGRIEQVAAGGPGSGRHKDYGESPNLLQEGDKVHIHPNYGGGRGTVDQVAPSGLFYGVKGKNGGYYHGSDLSKEPFPKE